MKSGVVILNKEEGITSQGAVNRVKRLFMADKAGHTGTLDPLATGVLPVLVGRAVKASEFLLTGDKHYRATFILGIQTDTEDITGKVIAQSSEFPSEKEVTEAVLSMLGQSMQVPPMYSAIKIGGRKLCDLAREGKTAEREPRPITIYEILPRRLSEMEYEIDVRCSKGTYIRTLCADIGKKLGCGAAMTTLKRLSAAGFGIEMAHTLSEIEDMTEEEREALIIPTEEIFADKEQVFLSDFYARLARCGAEIYIEKIGISLEIGEIVRLCDRCGFFALGEVRIFEAGAAIKPIRQFDV